MSMKIDPIVWAWISGYSMGLMVNALLMGQIILALIYFGCSLGAIWKALRSFKK